MSMMKDVYIKELERIEAEKLARGMDPKRAYDEAGVEAYDALRDRFIGPGAQLKAVENKDG